MGNDERPASSRDEQSRIDRAYVGYEATGASRAWDPSNAGNRRIIEERLRATRSALDRRGMWPPAGYRILDVGCGTGEEIARYIEWGADAADLFGVDLLDWRVARARVAHPEVRFVVADASGLDFPDREFRLVIASTLFSSILDSGMALSVASEIDRVLSDDGCVLWYDVRMPNPSNPNTQALRRKTIRRLFPGYKADLRPITLLPPLARLLGPATPLYPVLASIPLLRTHYLGTLVRNVT